MVGHLVVGWLDPGGGFDPPVPARQRDGIVVAFVGVGNDVRAVVKVDQHLRAIPIDRLFVKEFGGSI